MHAKPGDILVVEGVKAEEHRRQAMVLEVPHPDGTPPYRVRWHDGHEALVYPGPDAHIAAD